MINELGLNAVNIFTDQYGEIPDFLSVAPGRINLIGEHTDYSEGFVLPVAIDREIILAVKPRSDEIVNIYSDNFNEHVTIHLTNISTQSLSWYSYIEGIAWALMDAGHGLSGLDGVLIGNIPIGAGLSSSAALEVAVGKAFITANQLSIPDIEFVKLCKKAESEWVGVKIGIMDQLVSALGKKDHAIFLDCRSLAYEFIPIPKNLSLVVMDTNTRRSLSHSDYNQRHGEVSSAASQLGLKTLRDIIPSQLPWIKNKLPPTLYQRAKHVVTENHRVNAFVKAMKNNQLNEMGNLINASHTSLRDDFEVSSDALNAVVQIAQETDDCLGARMMGAGFGGCALALVRSDCVEVFIEKVKNNCFTQSSIHPNIYEVNASSGVRIVKNN